jgi:hypothetical protein
MRKPIKSGKKRSEMTIDEKAKASLRKRGLVWWTHFGFKGQFFRFSLGTSDKSKAQREAKRLIALAKTGKITAVAGSPEGRAARQSASAKKTATDPKVSAATEKRNAKRWKYASAEDRKRHGETIRNSPIAQAARLEVGRKVAKRWKDPAYKKRVARGVNRYWSDPRKHELHSQILLASGKKPKVQRNRRMGRLKAARNLLRRRGFLKEAGTRGRKTTPAPEKETFKIGLAIEMSIPRGLREDRKAIEEARTAYSERNHLPRELCATYHRRCRALLKANPSLIPDGASPSP